MRGPPDGHPPPGHIPTLPCRICNQLCHPLHKTEVLPTQVGRPHSESAPRGERQDAKSLPEEGRAAEPM
eukprot:9927495-Alexandrium_andersonii.AAC.1